MIAPTTRSPATRPATPHADRTPAAPPVASWTTRCRTGSTTHPATATSSDTTPRPPDRSRLDRPGTPSSSSSSAGTRLATVTVILHARRRRPKHGTLRRATAPQTWRVAATTTPEGARACGTHLSRHAPTSRGPLGDPPAAPRPRCGIHSADPHCRPMATIRPFRDCNVALVIAPREIAAITARRLSRSGERTLHRRIEAVDSLRVAACRVLLRAVPLSNKCSIIGSCHERGSICGGTPIRAGARPAERVAGQCRAPGEPSTQPVRRCCPALAGAKPAGTTDSPHSAPAAQLAHALRGAPVISETAPARHRHRSRPSDRTTFTHHPIPDHLSSSSRHFR
jgi:hypothetical protein